MAKRITFVSLVRQEGESGSTRSKVPAGLIKAIGAKDGDGIQFVVSGNTLVGAHVLKGRDLREAQAEAEGGRARTAPVKKAASPKAVVKPSQKPKFGSKLKSTGRKPLPPAKPSKRRTEVEYDAPPVKRSGKKKFLGKKKHK